MPIADAIHEAMLSRKNKEIIVLRERIQQLEDEIFQYRTFQKIQENSPSIQFPSWLRLTSSEFAYLSLLVERKGNVVRKEFIHSRIHQDSVDLKIVDVVVSKLRKKLRAGLDFEVIRTEWGMGYMIPIESYEMIKSWFQNIDASTSIITDDDVFAGV